MRSPPSSSAIEFCQYDAASKRRRSGRRRGSIRSRYRSVFAYRRALAPGGTYRCVGASVGTLLRVLTVGPVVGRLTGRAIGVLAVKQGPAHFEPLADLCVAGRVKIHIDHVFALNEVPAALARVGEGRALGKVVVGVA